MRINLKNTPVLVLNASYEAVNIVSAKRAFTSVMKGIAAVEETSAVTIRTGRLTLPVPAVIRLLEYRRIPRRSRMLSRKGILAPCPIPQHLPKYCLWNFPTASKLTLDHIVPRSRGGTNTRENLSSLLLRLQQPEGRQNSG